jgi:hypothetical protein
MNCFLENSKQIIHAPISLKRKVDALLFLFYYFVPIFCGVGLIFGVLTDHFYDHLFLSLGNLGLFVILLCLTPLLEILIGTLRSDKKRHVYLLPLMVFFFILNIFICVNAVFNLIKGNKKWIKTERTQIHRNTNRGTISTVFASILTILILSGSLVAPLIGDYDQQILSNIKESGGTLEIGEGVLVHSQPLNKTIKSPVRHESYQPSGGGNNSPINESGT